MVIGRDGIEAEIEQLLLDGVNLRNINADGWQYGATVFFLNADQDIASAQVVYIVGESTKRVQDGFRVPARLEFEALPFDGFAVEEVVDVDG